MKVELMESTVDPLYIVSKCARTSHRTEDKDKPETRENFVKSLAKLDHTPLEFAWTIWDIKGVSRACADQLRTYRIASHCMQSQRYVDISENEFVYPFKALKACEGCVDFVNKAKRFYKDLVNAGVPREDARYFMPMGLACNIKVGINMRNLIHFFKQRLAPEAQWEIKEVAQAMYDICREKWPWYGEVIDEINKA